METKVEEYVLVPKNVRNRTSIPSTSKPSDAHSSSDVQPENKSSSSSTGNNEAVEVGAAKEKAKWQKYTKRSVSEPEPKKSRKTESNETNRSIDDASQTNIDESTELKKNKKPRVKKVAINKPIDTLDTSSTEITTDKTENQIPLTNKPKRAKSHSSLKEKCARLGETWVKL